MTKMAAMFIYGENLLKSSSPEQDVYITAIIRSYLVANTFEWGKLIQSHLMRETL